MNETQPAGTGLIDASQLRLRVDVFDDLAAARGAASVPEQVKLTGVSRPSLYRIRAGKPPSFANATRILAALNVPLDVVFERAQDAA